MKSHEIYIFVGYLMNNPSTWMGWGNLKVVDWLRNDLAKTKWISNSDIINFLLQMKYCLLSEHRLIIINIKYDKVILVEIPNCSYEFELIVFIK